MFLKQLKLAGFKSFVEPTVVPFPGSLVAVVGPNGCGKSNIIDAVKWVLGESSAKNLRGESMVDVIFNGSSQRKAVGQASVELIFDNSIRRLSGAFSHFDEISVRRVVHRDGESQYFLNGSRCRKKDITDIFLGTGAGARGYSIIGQGTIARLIEARPEELRLYLEEAAGISKYKEKRKETLQRLERTKENLQRLYDIRVELESQTERLAAQSESALHYQRLSAEEKACKQRIAYRKWAEAQQAYHVLEEERHTLALAHQDLEGLAAQQREQTQHLRQDWQVAQDKVHQATEAFYEAQTSLSRVNALIEQAELQQARQQAELSELQNRYAQALLEAQALDAEHDTLSQEIARHKIRLEEQGAELETLQYQRDERLACFEETKLALQTKQQEISQTEQQRAIAELKLSHANARILAEQKQQERLQAELDTLTVSNNVNGQSSNMQTELVALQARLDEQQWCYDSAKAQGQDLQSRILAARQALKEEEHISYQLSVELAKRQAELAARLQKDVCQSIPQNLNLPCLAEVLQVPSPWQKVVEAWLGDVMQSRLLTEPELYEVLAQAVFAADEASPYFIETHKTLSCPAKQDFPVAKNLAQCLSRTLPNDIVAWERVFLVEDIAAARTLLQQQEEPCLCLLPDGGVISFAAFRKYHLDAVQTDSIFTVQTDVQRLERSLAEAKARLLACQNKATEMEQAKQTSEEQTRREQQILDVLHREYVELRSQQQAGQAIAEQAQKRQQDLVSEVSTLAASIIVLQRESEELQQTVGLLQGEYEELNQVRDALQEQHEQVQTEYEAVRASFEDSQHRFALGKREMTEFDEAQKHAQTAKARLQGEMGSVEQRIQSLQIASTHPDSDLVILRQQQESLGELLAQQQDAIALSKANADDLHHKLAAYDVLREEQQAQQKQLEERILDVKLKQQALWLKRENFETELTTLEGDPKVLAEQDDPSQTTRQMEARVLWLAREIQALGPINLTAIEEYQVQSARLAELTRQCDDLDTAIASLLDAIASIDKETITRFQEAFDDINARFQHLFPKLFGGGRAALIRSEGDALEAGVVVMAQPPGKRNSTIHLLSGGEKAMTAVALVMAIFQCNPSPFCMLDEVDAPLDDANVKRFCQVIAEMSDIVQFLFITHNKVTMELADHLIGVTMREAGVSRIVAVDVEQALTMRETNE